MFGEQTVVRLMARLCILHTDPPVHDAQLPTCGNIVVDHQADLCRELVNLTEAWWREYMSQQQLCHKDGSLWCEFVLYGSQFQAISQKLKLSAHYHPKWFPNGCRFLFLFFSLGHFSLLFATFWSKTRTLLNFGAKICHLHCSSICSWCSLIYPQFSSIFP